MALPDTANCLAEWQFNGNATDSSGSGFDLTDVNSPSYIAGHIGNAISYAAASSQYSIEQAGGTLGQFGRAIAFSVECWFKTSSSTQQIFMSRNDNGGVNKGWMVGILDDGKVYFWASNDSGNSKTCYVRSQAGTVYDDGVWHHFIATKATGSGAASEITIYVDGSAITLDTVTDGVDAEWTTADRFQVSGRDGANLEMTGTIDTSRLYDTELSSGEVSSLYNGGAGVGSLFASDAATRGIINANMQCAAGFSR